MLALFGGSPYWRLCVFGKPLLDAFEEDPPEVFSHPMKTFSLGAVRRFRARREQAHDAKVSELLIKLRISCELAKLEGLWTPELQGLEDALLSNDAGSDKDEILSSDEAEILAALIVRVEAVLNEHGIDYTPAMSHFSE